MNKKIYLIAFLTCVSAYASEVTVADYLRMEEGMQVDVLRELAALTAHDLGDTCRDVLSVAKLKHPYALFIYGLHHQTFKSDTGRTFQQAIQEGIPPARGILPLVKMFKTNQRKFVHMLTADSFEECFSDERLEAIARGCTPDLSQYRQDYFDIATDCMLLHHRASVVREILAEMKSGSFSEEIVHALKSIPMVMIAGSNPTLQQKFATLKSKMQLP
jgi:hypothetical protein